jgi:hypothetical protein
MANGLDDKYVLFELLDPETVTLRRSDMDYPDIRRQFLVLLSSFLGVEMTVNEWTLLLGRIPEEWGEYLGFRAAHRGSGMATATIFKAAREPGVNSGENPVITSIEKRAKH